MNEKELITLGLEWLSENIKFRDQINGAKGKPTPISNAVIYATNELRVISRVKNFLESSPSNLNWFHDHLINTNLNPEVFTVFFKLWSSYFPKITTQVN